MTDFSGYGLKFRNVKCFGATPEGFETIKPINIIIGRNNSGKSTLLDLFPVLIEHEFKPPERLWRQLNVRPSIELSLQLTSEMLARGFPRNLSGGIYRGFESHFEFARLHLDGRHVVVTNHDGNSASYQLVSIEKEHEFVGFVSEDRREHLKNDIASCVRNPFMAHRFHRVNPERSLKQEPDKDRPVLGDGSGATTKIQRFLNKASLPRDLVSRDLLEKLNEIVNPDAYFDEILARQIGTSDDWEIFLDERNKGRIPLSSSGHGLQTIILVLVHTMLLTYEDEDLNNHIFGFEELENNLHPALFRRLLMYLRSLALESGATLFITTHSHVAIDLFRKDEDAQIIHVTHDGDSAKCRTLTTYVDHGNVLDDLDVRASDILQANCVIWVEGPSDRIYLNRWIELASGGQLIEGIHYQCVFYGGRLLSHLSADAPESERKQAIQILSLNRRACVIIDSDKRTKRASINATKRRIRTEIESMKGIALVTNGKEIENYLPPEVVKSAWGLRNLPQFGEYDDVFDAIEKVKAGEGKKARKKKIQLAENAIKFINDDNWNVMDLETQVTKLCKRIREWNQMRE